MSQPFAIQSATGCDPADEWVRLGVDLHVKGKVEEAADKYTQALRIDPRHVTATLNLAIAYAQTAGRINDAILAIERARLLDTECFVVLTAQCLIYLEGGHIDEAIHAGRDAVMAAPKTAQGNHAHYALALVWPIAGYPGNAIPLYEEILKHEPQHGGGPNLSFVETLLPLTTWQVQASRRKWCDANRYNGEKQGHDNNSNPNRPLRVGYVSGDFKSHSAAFIFSQVVLNHSVFVSPYLYSTLAVDPNLDRVTRECKDHAGERWRDLSLLDDEKAEALIRKDKIDVLVDLSGHTGGGRLPLFTRKPAPIQITGWGFAHGTGVPEIDYFLADPISIPMDERHNLSEDVLDLPCVITFRPPVHYNTRASSPLPLKRNGYITFGAYGRYEKLSDDCLEVYRRVLDAVPDSRLEFKDAAFARPYSIKRILSIMGPDIEQERLLFSIGTNHLEHMRAYQQSDICLDPFPHGGGVVTVEQLYMGVPVMTLYGKQPAGRTAASVLTLIHDSSNGLVPGKDWIAYSPDEYVEKAVALASKVTSLSQYRKDLRQALLNSPVVKGYVESVEKIYRQCWHKYCMNTT